MSKTDDMIKNELESIGNYKSLKMRGFVGSSNYDQHLWVEGGLTFRYKNKSYGSCDFAWYKEEEWTESETDTICNCKPVLVVEGTDCLNTKSYGTAQIQRFHHVYGPFMNGGIIGVYYLREGDYEVRPDLMLSVYYANIVEKYKERKSAYLVVTKLEDIENLVRTIGDTGEYSEETWQLIDDLLTRMKDYALSKISQFDKYEDYLNKRCIFRTADGNWIKYLGPKKESFTNSAIRYGHIVLGEAFVAHYLLAGKGLIADGQKLLYFFPLIDDTDWASMKATLTKDKEFAILSACPFWKIITIDHISFDDDNLKAAIMAFNHLNLNILRKEWNKVRKQIEQSLKNNLYRID